MTALMLYKRCIGELTEGLRKIREYEREYYKRTLGVGVEVEEGEEDEADV